MNIDKITEKVKQNRHFVNNEDLLDSFVDVASARFEGLSDSIQDEEVLNSLLERIVSKSVIDVLKSASRYSTKHARRLQKVDYLGFNFDNIAHNKPTISIMKLKRLYSALKKINEDRTSPLFKIIDLRYKQNMNLKDISKELRIPEGEVVDILFQLSDYADKVDKV